MSDDDLYRAGDRLHERSNDMKSGNKIWKDCEHFYAPHCENKKLVKAYEEQDINNDMKNIEKLEREAARSNYKILIIDEKLSRSLSNKLHIKNSLGFKNITIADGSKEGRNLLLSYQYDLVLSSYRMNDYNGWDLHNFVQSLDEGVRPVFVLINGIDNMYELNNLKTSGVLVLPIPFSHDKLNKTINGFYIRKLRNMISKSLK